jgi:hypothetical protein
VLLLLLLLLLQEQHLRFAVSNEQQPLLLLRQHVGDAHHTTVPKGTAIACHLYMILKASCLCEPCIARPCIG